MTVLVALCLLHNGCTRQEHKWLFYDLDKDKDLVYQGYRVTTGAKKETNVPTGDQNQTVTIEDHTTILNAIRNRQTPPGIITLDKPTIDEDDQLHFVFYGSQLQPPKAFCKFEEKDYTQPHDTKMVPPYKEQKLTAEQALGRINLAQAALKQSKADLVGAHQEAQGFTVVADALDEAADKAQKAGAADADELDRKAQLARQRAIQAAEEEQTALDKVVQAEQRLAVDQAELEEAKNQREQATQRIAVVCDLDVREKGSKQIEYTLLNPNAALLLNTKDKPKVEDIVLKDSILVHELYRFRVIAGPVFTTLQKRNKHYSLKRNSMGQNEVSASAAQDSPANFVLMLKAYIFKRDVLNPPPLLSSRWYEMINPVFGINLLDKPLQNFYAGLSLEPVGGFDIILGAHWSKTQQLTAGFSQGQVTDQPVQTKERFNNGWFVGVAVDIGVLTNFLKNAGSGILNAIKPTS